MLPIASLAQPPALDTYATPAEAAALAGAAPLLAFPEDRTRPVRRDDALPKAWLGRTNAAAFAGDARPGEFFAFQIALYNPGETPLELVSARLDLPGATAHCLNVDVRPAAGEPLPPIAPKRLKTLWYVVDCPAQAAALAGSARIVCRDTVSGQTRTLDVSVRLTVAGAPLPDGGVGDAARLARLRWLLPSAIGEGNAPTKGFAPLTVRGRRIALTATRLTLDASGLPAQIEGLLDGSNGRRAPKPTPLLAAPARFVAAGKPWTHGPLRFTQTSPATLAWTVDSDADGLTLRTTGTLAFDGHLRYRMTVTAQRTVDVDDLRLAIPVRADAAPLAMGLGLRGGKRPERHAFVWNTANHQDRFWLGGVNVGAQWQLVGGNYRRPLVNIYYPLSPLNLPDSWGNGGSGGVRWTTTDGTVAVDAFSGPRTLAAGQSLTFGIEVQLTPARPIDTEKQWKVRFSHAPAAQILADAKDGANAVNLHHGQDQNPFINYPFHPEALPALTALVGKAHAQGQRFKVYYTTRELSKELPEFWALKALDGAAIQPGPGPATRTILHPNGPAKWLVENAGPSFIPAWSTTLGGAFAGREDISVLTRPDGPWNAFYLHGLDFLVREAQIDGVYIDDTALDRESLLRARRILEARRPDPLIDLHSWNPFDDLDSRIVSASLYLDLLPFVDRIWFGEGANYGQSAESWLVQYSGIPYGVMGEMLEGGGNPWRGMVFGMTARLRWSGDPRSLWKLWDSFGMAGTTMTGWWDRAVAVKTDRDAVKATTYAAPGRALIALASWDNGPVDVRLTVDAKRFGFTPKRFVARTIDGFQEARTFAVGEAIPVAPGKGWLLVAER